MPWRSASSTATIAGRSWRGFPDDQVRGDHRQPPPYRFAKQAIGIGVMLITPAAQCGPGAAIDEQACGSARVLGALRAARCLTCVGTGS